MSLPDLPDRVCTLITAHLDCADRFSWNADLRRDLGADSLDTVELTMACETEFGIHIEDRYADAWRTPDDMRKTVAELA